MYFFVNKRKRTKSRIFAGLLLSIVLFAGSLRIVKAEELSLYATAAVLMDADTGRVLYGKNEEEFLSNASTTKIMTCIVALENGDLEGTVEVSAYAASMPKVKLYMHEGEHFVLKDLLYSLMLESHNDSAVAIAEHVGGSMEKFAAMMNEKARAIGCENTWFITPNGLDATQTLTDEQGNSVSMAHGTTARDLALIMAYCTFDSPKKDQFLEITRTASYSFASEEGRSFSCNNHNAFLQMMEGALSGKTGFTNQAGYCYVGALERDGKRFTIALLACGWPNNKSYKWSDAKTLFQYGLEHFTYHRLAETEYDPALLSPIPVLEGQSDRIGGNALAEVELSEKGIYQEVIDGLLLSEEETIEIVSKVEKSLRAPVEAGLEVGYIRYQVGEQCLKEIRIVTKEAVEKIDFLWCFRMVLKKYVL